MFSGSCGLVISLSDGMNESFILTRLLLLLCSVLLLFLIVLLSLLCSMLPLLVLAAHVPSGFLLSPGDPVAGLADV